MISLSDITRQDDAIKMFKPWWELLKEYLLYAMLFVTVVINGFKLSQEKFICMPASEENGTCRYINNVSDSSCLNVEEIKSAAFSEYISLACTQHLHLFSKYFDLVLLIFPLFVYVLGVVFYNVPLTLYKFKDIHSIILHCNDDEVKALVTKLDIYIDNEVSKRRTGKYNDDIDILNKALDLQSVIQSTLKKGSYLETNVLRVGPQGEDYHNVPTEVEGNTSSFWEEEGRDILVSKQSRWFRFVYIIYTFLQFASFVAYIIIIVLSWNVLDHETKCVLKERYRYKYDFFLCRHSLRRIYQHLSFILIFLSVSFIFLIFTQSYLLMNGYRTKIRKYLDSSVFDLNGDQRFIMTFVYFCKKWYLTNFCRLFNKAFYQKINCYIADCKYPLHFMNKHVESHNGSLKLENITGFPSSIVNVLAITLLEVVNSDLSMEGVLSPLKGLACLTQLVLNSCKIQVFDVGNLPDKIVYLDILNNPLKKIIGRCPKLLNLCSVDEDICSMKWTNSENVVILNAKVVRRNAPVEWEGIYSYIKQYKLEQLKGIGGEVRIFSNKVNIHRCGKITNVENSNSNSSELGAYGAMKDVVFLKGIFRLLNYIVHLHGADDIENYIRQFGSASESVNLYCQPRGIFFFFMGDIQNNEINMPNVGRIKIVDLIAKFSTVSYDSPTFSVSLMTDSVHNFSTLESEISVWNIFYACVPQASFQNNLLKYLTSEHEDDLASTISGWEGSRILDFLYRKFYLLPGFPWLDSNFLLLRMELTEEEQRYRQLVTTINRHHLSTNIEDVVTSMSNINTISAVQKSIGRIKLANQQITCCSISSNWVLVAYPDIRWLITECQQTNPLCVEFKIKGKMETFQLKKIFKPDYVLGVVCFKLQGGQNNIPEPVVLDSSPICDQVFVMGYPEELDSDLILESHCQVYTEQSIFMGARNADDTGQPQGSATRENQSILERDLNDVQKLWLKRPVNFSGNNEYEDLLNHFRRNNIYVIRLPTKFTEVCRSALVVCLDAHRRPCVKAFYNQRCPESIYTNNDVVRARELLFQAAVKSFNVQKHVDTAVIV